MAVACTTLDEIEDALGRSLTVDEQAKATYYIGVISAFIESYCDLISLQEVLDDVIRLQADYYGIIELGGGPISSVASVTDVDGTEVTGYAFDGSGMISGLAPFQTVDITYSHGLDEVPADIRAIATEAVVGTIVLQLSGPLKTRTVGDVTYSFQEGSNVGVQLASGVLDRYKTTEYTMRLGPSNSREINYPINWFQISG